MYVYIYIYIYIYNTTDLRFSHQLTGSLSSDGGGLKNRKIIMFVTRSIQFPQLTAARKSQLLNIWFNAL